MNQTSDLLNQESHFAFGKNWASYAEQVTETEIAEAVAGLSKLAGSSLAGCRFLDIGSGSGLHALAALRLGAKEVVALDIDPDSIATTRKVLQAHAPGLNWRAEVKSVFELTSADPGMFDVVYSWGVLHHTGDMYRALRSAAALVSEGGTFIFALYLKTRLCEVWKVEKRWYTRASPRTQKFMRDLYVRLFRIGRWIKTRESFAHYVTNYRTGRRGMDFYHDVHDWMGGWPYESATPVEIERFMGTLGMQSARASNWRKLGSGVFGSGCEEYVYRRSAATAPKR